MSYIYELKYQSQLISDAANVTFSVYNEQQVVFTGFQKEGCFSGQFVFFGQLYVC